ncbi:MAG: NADH-quinone oxidoreductase subunit K [Actinobacteria bacterium]|nr:NADH-quinone oxidoreductase subunit K [Actinomycetota bacterium]
MLSLKNYLYISTIIFCLGIFGVLYRKRFIHKLIASSLIALSTIINFVSFSYFLYPEGSSEWILGIFIIGLIIMQFAVGLFVYYFIQTKERDIDMESVDPFLRFGIKMAKFFRRK